MPSDKSTSYGIGSVSRLTGLTTHTLRAWEKRHGAVAASRDAAGRRRYTLADLERLTQLKQLVDLGERIGDLARLSPQDLEQRLADAQAHGTTLRPRAAPVRIGLFGPAAHRLGQAFHNRLRDFSVIAVSPDLGLTGLAQRASDLDCIVLDVPSLGPGDVPPIEQLIEDSPDCAVVLVHAFARDTELRRLEQSGVVLIGSTSSNADIRRAVVAATLNQPNTEKTADSARARAAADGPRFTAAELMRLASISTDIECECPHHLVSLINYLRAFEQYSADCKNRNVADAAMHEFLYRETRRASQIIENGLRYLIEFEGIDLDRRGPERD